MELDISKLNIGQLYQIFGEISLQLEILNAKQAQIKAFIAQRSNEIQKANEDLIKTEKLKESCGASKCCQEQVEQSNGIAPEAA